MRKYKNDWNKKIIKKFTVTLHAIAAMFVLKMI